MKTAIPKEAVAAVLLDSNGRVLLAKRDTQLRFDGGHHTFPEGVIDTADPAYADLVVGAESHSDDPIERNQVAADCFALSCSLFRQTGLVFAEGQLPSLAVQENTRRRLLEDDRCYASFLSEYQLFIDASKVQAAGIFVTPETTSRRFRRRQYLLDLSSCKGTEQLMPGELTDLDWVTPQQALDLWDANEFQLTSAVATTLRALCDSDRATGLQQLEAAKRFTSHTASFYEVRSGINVIPLLSPTLAPARHTNCIVVGQRERVIIDPAATDAAEQARLLQTLAHLLDEGDKVVAILLTHGHRDHHGSAELLRKEFGAPIWCHSETANKLKFTIDRILGDDEQIHLAGNHPWTLRALHTPGHHPGHLCFLEESTATLIAGDIVSGLSTVVIPHGHGGDMTDYLNSLHRLLTYSLDALLPAHGFVISDASRFLRVQVEHRRVRENQIKEAIDAGIRGIEDLLTACYGVPENMRKYASFTLKAHLVRLGITDFDE